MNGFSACYDKSGLSSSQVPVLLYAKDFTDITASLLKNLNKDAPGEDSGAKPEAAGVIKVVPEP